jgi:hypothetical protein
MLPFFYQQSWSTCFGIPCNIVTVATMESRAVKNKRVNKDRSSSARICVIHHTLTFKIAAFSS